MVEQTRAGVAQTHKQTDIRVSSSERELLRRLAGRVRELSERPIEARKRDLWYKHNSLQGDCPLIFCDPENGWNEIINHTIGKDPNRVIRWVQIAREEIDRAGDRKR